jgi:hypothetical protein
MIKVTIKNTLRKDFDRVVQDALGKKKKEMLSALKAATPIDTGEARQGWQIEGNSLVNRVDHIERLNEGSSQQAPAHFIERTLLQQPGVVPNGMIVTNTR